MKVIEPKPYVGFRVIEIPLGLARKMVSGKPSGTFPGAEKLVNDYPFLDDLTAVQINEFDNSMTVVKVNGEYKILQKNSKSGE
jgi:hypothetical protein